MNAWILDGAAFLAAAIGVAHSWLGERRILGPLLVPGQWSGTLDASDFLRRTVRFAWHLTSIAWVGSAAVLWSLAGVEPSALAIRILAVLGAVYGATAAVTLLASRGRHLAWPLLLLIALAAWGSAIADAGSDAVKLATSALGYGAAAILVTLAAVHAYWAGGGHQLKSAAIPEREGEALFAPSVVGTALVALALFAAALLIALRLGVIVVPIPAIVSTVDCWLLAAIFIMRAIGEFRYVGFFKRVTRSRFARWDTALYSPLCLTLGLAIAGVSACAG
jgi:hypothetical protein